MSCAPLSSFRAGAPSMLGLLLLGTAPELAHAAPPTPVVAIFDLEDRASALSTEQRDRLSDDLTMEVAATGRFQVVPRGALRNRLVNTQAGARRDCATEACQHELGRELGAERVLGAQLAKVGEACHLSLRLSDLVSAHRERSTTVVGGCREAEVKASLKQGVRRLIGLQLQRPDLRLAIADPASMAHASPAPAPGQGPGLDFGLVDVEALELFDLAVRTEDDSTRTARQKIDAWRAVEVKAPEYAAVAKARQQLWSDDLRAEEEAARARAQLDADWGKLSRLLKLSVVSEDDKLQWALAFVEAYGADPQLNPYLDDRLLQSFLRIAEWRPIEAQVLTAPGSEAVTRLVIQFLVRHPDYPPAKEAFNRLRRANRRGPGGESELPPDVHN